MTDRRSFLKGLLSSIGGIMIVRPPSIETILKPPEEPEPPAKPASSGFYTGSSMFFPGFFNPSETAEPTDGYVGTHPPYSDNGVTMADPFPSGYLTEQTSPEEEKRIRMARKEWAKRNNV